MTQEVLRSGDWSQKFTERARRVLAVAEETARSENKSVIGVSYLVSSLTQNDGISGKVLAELVGDIELFRHGVATMGTEETSEGSTEVKLSDQFKKAIEASIEEAEALGHHYIGTEHLLLGILSVARQEPIPVFEAFNVTYDRAKAKIDKMLGITAARETERVRETMRKGVEEPVGLSRFLIELKNEDWAIQVLSAPGVNEPAIVQEIGNDFVIIKDDEESVVAIPTNLATFRIKSPEKDLPQKT